MPQLSGSFPADTAKSGTPWDFADCTQLERVLAKADGFVSTGMLPVQPLGLVWVVVSGPPGDPPGPVPQGVIHTVTPY